MTAKGWSQNNLEKTDPSEIERTYNIRKKQMVSSDLTKTLALIKGSTLSILFIFLNSFDYFSHLQKVFDQFAYLLNKKIM